VGSCGFAIVEESTKAGDKLISELIRGGELKDVDGFEVTYPGRKSWPSIPMSWE